MVRSLGVASVTDPLLMILEDEAAPPSGFWEAGTALDALAAPFGENSGGMLPDGKVLAQPLIAE